MFQPQEITCTKCNHKGRIITEDIYESHLSFDSVTNRIVATIRCPSCGKEFDLTFEQILRYQNKAHFRCVTDPNLHLEMWRQIENNKPKMPVFHSLGSRSAFEKTLDSVARKKADLVYGWKDKAITSGDIVKIFGDLKDYTKKKSWKTFREDHFITVIVSEDNINNTRIGFNGKFEPVKQKNPALLRDFSVVLKGSPDKFSSQFCEFFVGRCAEAHAANLFMNDNPHIPLSDLSFSIAYDCRTVSQRSYCMNCITLFGLKNG